VFKHAAQKPVEVLHSKRLKQWENHVAWENIVAKLLQDHETSENIQSVEVNESKPQEQMFSMLQQWANAEKLPDTNSNAQSLNLNETCRRKKCRIEKKELIKQWEAIRAEWVTVRNNSQ